MFGEKGYCKVLVKKTLVNVDLHRQFPIILTVKQSRTMQISNHINSKMKPNDTILNIDELMYIMKRTPYFSGFILCHVLVVYCLMITSSLV